jgi:hypothetical protein
MRILALTFALALAAGSAAAGNLYKWTDKDGNVHYTDQLPPPDAKVLERKKFSDTPADAPSSSYALQQAIKNFPVTLYNADSCDACTKASTFLTQRGVPFTEKNARDPAVAQELKALTGKTRSPRDATRQPGELYGYEEGRLEMAWTPPVIPARRQCLRQQQHTKPGARETPKPRTPKPEASPAGSAICCSDFCLTEGTR